MQGITIPFWLFLLLILFAVIALLDRVLAPSVRWFFRRRVNKAISELNTRLDTHIQPFKLTRKQTLVDQLMYDQEVVSAAEYEAKETGTPISVIMEKAERYAREIVPSFSPLAYFGFGMRFARIVSKFIYRVRVGYVDDEALRKIDPDASVVFVMNHRSNMDYLLVTYLASTRTTLSYAVGEWARIWGLQSLIRAMGAYFIRRSSKNELYRKVLARYVAMATREGVPQAFFPEGGLSTNGKLRDPKFGLLSYMLSGYSQTNGRDVVFVPVGINYDRVMEDRILTKNLEKDSTGRDYRISISKSASYIFNMIWRRLQGKLYKNGHACVSFGNPISLNEWMQKNKTSFGKSTQKQKSKIIEKLGDNLIKQVGNVIPIMPVALVASVFARKNTKPLTELELKSEVFKLVSNYEKQGYYVHIPREDHDYAMSTGLRMLTLRHIILEDENGLFKANPEETVILNYYANSIAHLK